LILPEEVYALIEQKLNNEDALPRYARVQMSLLDILSGDFFNHYIKIGQHYSSCQETRLWM
jgi:ribonuclease P/MRP protein subunit RPP40